jgi:quinol monooxygenase YgiN
MVIQVIHHKVKDYKKWRPVFDEYAKTRKEYGCTGTTIYRSTNDPNDLTVLGKWENLERVQSLSNAPADMREIMEKAGVIGQLESWLLEEVEKVPF